MKRKYIPDGDFRYEFEELSIDDSENLFDGSCNVTWEYESGDMSVGVHDGFSFYVDDIYIQIPNDKPAWLVPKSCPLYDSIAKAIEKENGDHILGIIERKAEPDYFDE